MKILFSFLSMLISVGIYAQNTTPVVVISDKLCKIFVDGVQQSIADENTPVTLKLTLGEHLIQAKTEAGMLTQTINILDDKQKVVSFSFLKNATKTPEAKVDNKTSEVLILNTDFNLGSEYTEHEFSEVFVFDKGDVLKLKMNMSEEKGTNNVYILSYPDGKTLYSRKKIKSLDDSVEITEKGMYELVMNTNFIFNRNITVNLKRMPGAGSTSAFNTTPAVKTDTVFTKLGTYRNVITSGGFSQSIVLPEGTAYWCYWIGIGDDANVKYETYSEIYAEGKRGNEGDLLYAYGTSKKETLPMLSTGKIMTYRFANDENKTLFLNKQPYKYLNFKYGSDITTDYGFITTVPKQLNLLVEANNAQKGQTVYFRAAAFVINQTYYIPK